MYAIAESICERTVTSIVKSVHLEDFRCFHGKHTIDLAPITLLVGENSCGKTSFLALIRALSSLVQRVGTGYPINGSAAFSGPPFDLGSFFEIAHHRGSRGGRATKFTVGVGLSGQTRGEQSSLDVTDYIYRFEERRSMPSLRSCRISSMDNFIEIEREKERIIEFCFGNSESRLQWIPVEIVQDRGIEISMFQVLLLPSGIKNGLQYESDFGTITRLMGPDLTRGELQDIARLGNMCREFSAQNVVSIAPVRSQPKRTYDPAQIELNPEGDHIPMLLANLSFSSKKVWAKTKKALEEFGKQSGLFDELDVKHFGTKGSGPFQIQVRKFGKNLMGPKRNIVDMGYGISQILPIVAQLIITKRPSVFLVQQPEVHLHPSAEAALASYLCSRGKKGHQLIVETHGKYLIDRIRMAVQEKDTGVSPDDVMILYFERKGIGVAIHSITIDSQGNLHGEPPSYGSFFMKEMKRSLGLF